VTRKRLFPATIAAGLLGAGFMLPFEGPLTRTLGTTFLIAFVVLGSLLIASPEFLSQDEKEG
jgi:hypothetical protein